MLVLIVLAAGLVLGLRWASSPRGRYVLATSALGGGPGRVKPVLEATLARAARELALPPPAPQLLCQPDSAGTHLCTAVIGLAPGVSTIQGNTVFTNRLLELGASFLSGAEERDGTVSLRFRTGSKVRLALELVPAGSAGLDTAVTSGPGQTRIDVKGRLALVIDDYGVDRALTRRFLDLPGTFTAAVRPNLPDAGALAREAVREGMEVILNLPMEPRDYPTRTPGGDAILVDLSGKEIRTRVEKSLDKVGPVLGVKTHLGELAVEDRDVMRPVLEEMKRRGLYFVDATRSAYSSVPELARELGVPVYLVTSVSEVDEGKSDVSTVTIRFEDLARKCRAQGYAVGIIHAKEGTHAVLARELPRLAREGIVVMGLSEVMKVHALK